MSDILADYREWRDAQPGAIKAHSDRCHLWHRDCMIHRLADALERARLTDAERDAVGRAAMLIDDTVIGDSDLALNDYQALRGLYERTQ